MQQSQINFAFISIALASLVCGTSAFGALNITPFEMTESSFSVAFSGNLPETPHPDDKLEARENIFAVESSNTGSEAFFKFVNSHISPSNQSFTGDQDLSGGTALGRGFFGRAGVGFEFSEPLEAGEVMDGTVRMTWDSDVFNPSFASSLDFYWGSDIENLDQNIYLGTSTIVPEPSAAALLLGLVAICLAATRRNVKA